MQSYTWVNLRWFGDKKSKNTKFPAVVLTDVGFLPEKSGDFPTCFRDDFSGSAAKLCRVVGITEKAAVICQNISTKCIQNLFKLQIVIIPDTSLRKFPVIYLTETYHAVTIPLTLLPLTANSL